jgi:hypothetical protein
MYVLTFVLMCKISRHPTVKLTPVIPVITDTRLEYYNPKYAYPKP